MDPVTAILVPLAIALAGPMIWELIKSSPRLMRLVRRSLFGSNILILGRSGAGKTSFWNFLRDGQFADTFRPIPTTRPRPLKAFSIKKGSDLTLDIAATEDLPGDWPVTALADVIARQRPALLVVFTSLVDAKALPWFTSFCTQLNSLLLSNAAATKALRGIVVVQNKQDLVSEEIVADRAKALRRIMIEELRPALGTAGQGIPIVPCTLYKSSNGEAAANFLCATMIEALSSKQSLVENYARD